MKKAGSERETAGVPEWQQLFDGVSRLLGQRAVEVLLQKHVMIVGLGGVGSWAAEAIARTGVGRITLVDGDFVEPSNTNRQLPALRPYWGQPKALVLAERFRQIHPQARIEAWVRFFDPTEEEEFFQGQPDVLIDAIDRPGAKAALLAGAWKRRILTVTCGGAGGRRDPLRVRVADLAFTSHDRLLEKVRILLRRKYAFPKGGQPFGIPCVYSTEPMFWGGIGSDHMDPDHRRKYGTVAFVTGVFGLTAAAEAIRLLLRRAGLDPEERKL